MSIFSKLFPGAAKEEADDPLAPSDGGSGEEGPSMKRTPTDGRSPATPVRQEPPPQKVVAPSGSNAGGPPGAPKGPAPASPRANEVRSGPPAPQARPPALSRPAPPPQAPEARPAVASHATTTAPKGAPTAPAAVTITPSIDIGGAPTRSRPAAPSIQIPAIPVAAVPSPPAAPSPAPPKAPQPPRLPEPHKAAPNDAVAGSSVRPPAPEMTTSDGQFSIADTFERLLGSELDEGFASLERPSSAPAPLGLALTEIAEVRVLFAELAANHVRSVRDFVIDLRWSDATADWLPICEPALRSLRRAADTLELKPLCAALDRFSEALSLVQTLEGRTIGGSLRDTLLQCYDDLSREMPQAFALDLDRRQREGVILQSLLLQVPDVKKVTLDKMVAAGLSSLEAFSLATPADIAATTGIPEALATRIVARFRAYRDQVKATIPDASRLRERERIAALTSQLRQEHEAYERAAESWTPEANERKKGLRKARAQTLLAIQVELARLGEIERLARLDRLPFEGKLTQLESFLEDARETYLAQP